MRPRRTPLSNKVFRLSGGNEDNDLWVQETIDMSGSPVILSTWELSDEERAAIAAGQNIELAVWGNQHPPASLAVVDTPLGKDGNG